MFFGSYITFFKMFDVGGSVFALLWIQKHNLKRSEEGPVCQKAFFFHIDIDLVRDIFSS